PLRQHGVTQAAHCILLDTPRIQCRISPTERRSACFGGGHDCGDRSGGTFQTVECNFHASGRLLALSGHRLDATGQLFGLLVDLLKNLARLVLGANHDFYVSGHVAISPDARRRSYSGRFPAWSTCSRTTPIDRGRHRGPAASPWLPAPRGSPPGSTPSRCTFAGSHRPTHTRHRRTPRRF